jgi:hypothetical protein
VAVLSDFEKEVVRAIEPALFGYRLLQLEESHREIKARMETLATKQDVKDIKERIDLSTEHRFEWWKLVVGAFLAAVLFFGFQLAANAINSPNTTYAAPRR